MTASLSAGPYVRGRVVVHHRPAKITVVKVNRNIGWVDINCNQKKASVYVNGAYAGTAGKFDGWPGKLELKPGKYTIKVKHDGQTYRQKVRVTRGGEVDLNIKF